VKIYEKVVKMSQSEEDSEDKEIDELIAEQKYHRDIHRPYPPRRKQTMPRKRKKSPS